ncbi:kyphoscoliosis peptidase-like isoform X2 [Phyllobates terribilis]|uniref:kyphoscoliosis peptidase-like isoform X2 n=1 Tax=Phyllobates terribilis TaxID=111132 RepID=UPI003CCA8F9A
MALLEIDCCLICTCFLPLGQRRDGKPCLSIFSRLFSNKVVNFDGGQEIKNEDSDFKYDKKSLQNIFRSSELDEPEQVLRRRKGVCAGYSSLFQAMCRHAGVICVIVNGYGKGAEYQVGQKMPFFNDHTWNMVYLEGRWHHLDSTWGAGNVDEGTCKFTFEYNEFYFLTHPALFIEDHYPHMKKDQLLQPRVSKKQFEQFVVRTEDFFNLGLLSVQPESGIIKSENGKVSITVEGQQNLEFTFNVNGAQDGVLKLLKCGMNLDVYLQKSGEHKLSIFAKRPGSTDSFSWVLSYKILCKAVETSMKIPKCLSNPAGPSWVTEDAGLVDPSHPEPVIQTEDGCFSISFKTTRGLNFFYSLISDENQIPSNMERRHVLLIQTKGKVEMKVRLPRSGTYVLNIFINPEGSESSSYTYLCNYLIICTNHSVKWPAFPETWGKSFNLVHPLEGILPKNSNVSFKIQIPNVTKVCIDGEKYIPLTLSDSGYWEGTCSTQGREELHVMTQSKEPDSWLYLLKYEISE